MNKIDRLVTWARENGMYISDKVGFKMSGDYAEAYAKSVILVNSLEILFTLRKTICSLNALLRSDSLRELLKQIPKAKNLMSTFLLTKWTLTT